MKKLSFILIIVLVFSSIVVYAAPKLPEPIPEVTLEDPMPNGPHYNLNIIGVSKEKSMDALNSNGHVIFVPLFGKARIELIEGDDYRVLEKNGTDGSAQFQLPNPDPDNIGKTEYSVYARALGKPGGKATMTAIAVELDKTEWYSAGSLVLESKRGPSKFTNVSKELLYVYVDYDGDGTAERYNLFNDKFEDYFWEYDNKGLKLAQLRFYEVSTIDIPATMPAITK